jgi:hypothetical protein
MISQSLSVVVALVLLAVPLAVPLAAAAGNPAPANARQQAAVGQVCLLAFDDADGNGVQDEGEGLVPGAQFTVSDSSHVVATYTTNGQSEPRCISLLPGEYRISALVPVDRHATTTQSWRPLLAAGGVAVFAELGTAEGEGAAPGPAEFNVQATLLSLSGILFFGAAIVVLGYIVLKRRQ